MPTCKSAGPQPFRFDHLRGSPIKDASGMVAPTVNHHDIGPGGAKIAIDIGETKGLSVTLIPLTFPWTVGLRVTGVHYQWLPQCHLGLTGQMDPSIPEEGDGTERTELT